MYIEKTFQETYGLVKKYNKNILLYALIMIVSTIVSMPMYTGLQIFSEFLPDIMYILITLTSTSEIVVFALIISLFTILFLIYASIEIFFQLIQTRVIYLTSKSTEIPINVASFSLLTDYAKVNFIQFIKLILVSILIYIAILVIIFIISIGLIFALIGSTFNGDLDFNSLVVPIVFVSSVTLIASIIFGICFSIAHMLFFMGNENIDAIKLLKTGWNIFTSNTIEWILFELSMLVVLLIYIILLSVFLILSCICIGIPLMAIFVVVSLFAIQLASFIFLSHFVQKINATKAIY